jgi:hypothetical protein
VELGNNARVYDWGFTWSLSWEHLIGSGDVWVGVTYSPGAIRGLRAFDAGRYAPLSFANPGSEACGAAAVPGTEGGLAPDMLSQLAALLRDPSGPLGVEAAEYVYAVSHGVELPTYVAAVHPRSRLADGRAPYDGFLLHRHNLLASLHECGSAPPAGDARHVIRDAGAPVIRIVSETDVLATLDMRREDSDAPGDRYRLYEVAGAPHADGAFYRQLPALGDQEAAGTRPFLTYWPFASQCEPEIPIQELGVMRYVTDAALRNLDAWARGGEAPPRAARIEVSAVEDRDILRDEFGNALGGVRSPDLDAPRARYFTSAGGPGGCRNLGYSEPFGWSRLEDIYGSFGGWAERVRISVESLLDRGWLTPADARRILADRFEP